jgi:O-antigen biosynthesis protein
MISNPLLLIIGSVWPEPNSSAAGYRMMQIIESFQSKNRKIHFVSTAADSAFKFPLETINIDYSIVQLNHSSFDNFIKKTKSNYCIV